MKKIGYITLFKNKTFLKVWISQLISLVTAYMLNFILIDRIYSATGSTIAVGLFWGFYILPSATLGPFVGVFLDYLSKQRILIVSNLLQAFVVLLYLGVGQKIWPVYTIVLLYSFCDEFFNPAVGAFLPALVKKKELPAANSLFMLTTQTALIGGFLVGGFILRLFHFQNFPFVLASFLLILAAVFSSLIPQDKPALERKSKANFKDFLKDLMHGYHFIRNEQRVFFPILLLTGLQILGGIGLILLPSISQEHLKIQFMDSSFTIIIPALIGGIFGGILVERLLKKHLKRVLIIFGICLLGFTISILAVLPILTKSPGYFSPTLALIMGAASVMMYIPLQTLVQEHTPFDVRGRVFGTLSTLITLAAAIPVLITTTLVDFMGISLILFLIGAMLVVLAGYAAQGRYGIIPNSNRSADASSFSK